MLFTENKRQEGDQNFILQRDQDKEEFYGHLSRQHKFSLTTISKFLYLCLILSLVKAAQEAETTGHIDHSRTRLQDRE